MSALQVLLTTGSRSVSFEDIANQKTLIAAAEEELKERDIRLNAELEQEAQEAARCTEKRRQLEAAFMELEGQENDLAEKGRQTRVAIAELAQQRQILDAVRLRVHDAEEEAHRQTIERENQRERELLMGLQVEVDKKERELQDLKYMIQESRQHIVDREKQVDILRLRREVQRSHGIVSALGNSGGGGGGNGLSSSGGGNTIIPVATPSARPASLSSLSSQKLVLGAQSAATSLGPAAFVTPKLSSKVVSVSSLNSRPQQIQQQIIYQQQQQQQQPRPILSTTAFFAPETHVTRTSISSAGGSVLRHSPTSTRSVLDVINA